jgi:hypothetical protein
MKMFIFLVVLLTLLMVVMVEHSASDTKYNPMTGEWELTTPGARLEYDAMNGEWGYVPKGVSDGFGKVVDTCPGDCTGSIPDLGLPDFIRNKGRTDRSSGK